MEQLKNNRELLASTLPGEDRIGSTNSVNSRHLEDNDHHAAKVLTTFYHPVTNALQNGIETLGCRPPTMVAISVTKNFHEQIVTDTRATVDKAPESNRGCVKKYSGAVRGGEEHIKDQLRLNSGAPHAHWLLTQLIREEMHTLSTGKIKLAACSDESQGHSTQYSMSYLVFKADDNEKGGVHALCVEIWRDWTLHPSESA